VVGLNKGVKVIAASRVENLTVKQIVQSSTMGNVELYDTHKTKSKIRNKQLICRNVSMKEKLRKAGYV